MDTKDAERAKHNTRIEICNATTVNAHLDYFKVDNVLCINLYYHATKSTISITDAWGGSDIISGVRYSFDEIGSKNIQIILSKDDIEILTQKGMCILPSSDDGGFTLYKVSIKKVQSN